MFITDEWIMKCYIIEFYSAAKKNHIMKIEVKWKDPEINLVSDLTKAQKGKQHMLSFIAGLQLLIFMHVYICGYEYRDRS